MAGVGIVWQVLAMHRKARALLRVILQLSIASPVALGKTCLLVGSVLLCLSAACTQRHRAWQQYSQEP